MLRLSTTTDKIQVILGGAITTNQLDCVATYKDINVSAAYTASAPSLVATNGTTAVDLVDSPASDTQRFVDFISVFNTDTANATVTIRLNRNGTLGVLFRCVLGVGELVTYTEGQGWVVYQNNGSIKNAATVTDGSITAPKLNGAQTGSAPIFGVRAWVNFNGTGTVAIRASGNVSSITDNGTGDYTVNFTTSMPDANYAVVCQVGGTGGEQSPITAEQTSARTASNFRFASITGAGTAIDCAQLGVMVIR